MTFNITTGSYTPPQSETVNEIKGNQYDRRSYTRQWYVGESSRFESDSNEDGMVRICCVEERKPAEESTSSTKATWFVQPLNWMQTGTWKFNSQMLGIVNIDTIVKQFDIVDIELMDGWEDKAKSDLDTCAKYSWSNDVEWHTDTATGMYRAVVKLRWLEKLDGELVTFNPAIHEFSIETEWMRGNTLESCQGPIMNKFRDDIRDFYAGMKIVSKA